MIKLEQRQNIKQHAVVFIFSNRVDSVTVILISTKKVITLMSETTLKRLNVRMVEERLCWHRQTIWRKYTAGKFPKPHYLGQNRVWWGHEIAQWEAKQMLSQGSHKKVSGDASDKQVTEACSGESFYTMSGSSPPDVTSSEEGGRHDK